MRCIHLIEIHLNCKFSFVFWTNLFETELKLI